MTKPDDEKLLYGFDPGEFKGKSSLGQEPAFPALKYEHIEAGGAIGDYSSEQGVSKRYWTAVSVASQRCREYTDIKLNADQIVSESYLLADKLMEKENE